MAHCDANSVVWPGFSFQGRFDDLEPFHAFLAENGIRTGIPLDGPWELLIFPPDADDMLIAVDSDGAILISGKCRPPTEAEYRRLSLLMHRLLKRFDNPDDEAREREEAQIRPRRTRRVRHATFTGGDDEKAAPVEEPAHEDARAEATGREDAHTEEAPPPKAEAPPAPQPAPPEPAPGPLQRAGRGMKRTKDSVVETVTHYCSIL